MDVIDLKTEAKKCLDSESAAYHLKQSRMYNSEYSWLKTALSRGTISDKVAAGIVMIQNSPKYNLNQLTILISQVKIAKHNQCSTIIDAIKDLFLNDLLHPKFKLLKFEEQDLDKLDSVDASYQDDNINLKNRKATSKNKLLGIWYFEDQLKDIYERFVISLSNIVNDTVDLNREKAISVMTELLIGNSEQEHKLLDLIINKIGDPSSKVASKTVFSLTKLLYKHSNMKLVVLQEVEKLLFRNNVSQRTQYFAICLLTQFVLFKEDTAIATNLINVYFAFFNACLKRGEPDTRMMGAILTGVNRAYPFADINSTQLNKHIDSIYRVVYYGSFNVSLSALNLLFQVVSKNADQSDRFYSTFYRKLFNSQIGISSKRAIFLNLLFKVLRSDQSQLRMHAFIKRILQICTYFPANMTCATLYVISQVLHLKKRTKNILIVSRKTINSDTEIESNDKSDEVDDNKGNDVAAMKEESTIVLSNVITETGEENVNDDEKLKNGEIKLEIKTKVYDPFIRNPLHCGAHLSFYCELKGLAKHFHPSVSLFAKMILEGKHIRYTGDPLEDLSLIRFLDRYVFKNPKKLESKKVSRKNDPLAQRAAYTPRGIRAIPVNSSLYIKEREDRIPVDELFLYQYMQKQKEFKGIKKLTSRVEEDNESVNSEDFNDMLDQMSKRKSLDDLDIAGDLVPRKITKENDDDMESEDSDSSVEEELNEELNNLSDLDSIDDDLSDMEFNDEDEDENEDEEGVVQQSASGKRKMNKVVKNIGKKLKGLDDNTFVSAEQFAEMLEEQGHAKFKYGASSLYSDRDGASAKQLDWETERNERISGFRGGRKATVAKSANKFKGKKAFTKRQKAVKRKK
ncbi:PREDICTED: CCAAT/enhancer-binding protein zeta [Ceratosolen solmsi marchali]|uniref:CCAAT/enhancer-binding protein zeta n=1 Tax=Ceratosolen solmsi marchali TaxID=326594 RepID=A0AAJ7DTD9_9HYME|nr:PREDICTED: CCAAT/enhancer-binding protein zeta [Ceratosolen solmsi marchali]